MSRFSGRYRDIFLAKMAHQPHLPRKNWPICLGFCWVGLFWLTAAWWEQACLPRSEKKRLI